MKSNAAFFLCTLLPLAPTAARAADASSASNQKPEWTDVQPQGAPTRYMVDVERYRYGDKLTVSNFVFYPIPQEYVNPGSKGAYVDKLQTTAHASLGVRPDN